MEQEPKVEKLPSQTLKDLGFTTNHFVDSEVEPKTFDTVDRGGEVVVIAYDEHRKEWALASTLSVAELEEMMIQQGFTSGPSPYAPRKEDPIN